MKLRVDRGNDSLYFFLSDAKVDSTDEVQPGVILDFDSDNNVIGFELLGLSKRVPAETLTRIELETT
jgi:uncharacterized protein YuzE